MYGFDESDIPAGYHDADLEMRELEERGNELARSIRSKPQVSVTIGGTTFYGAPEMLEVPGFDEHENGQLRLGAEGDQLALLALPAEGIPESDGPPLVSPAVAELSTAGTDVLHDLACDRAREHHRKEG